MVFDEVEIVVALVREVQAVGDEGVLGKAVEGFKIAWADDHGVCRDDALCGGFWVLFPAKVLVAGIVDHVVLGIAAETYMGRGAGVVCEILEQLDGKLVGVVPAGKGEEIRGLDAKAGEGRVEIVRDDGAGATRGGRQLQRLGGGRRGEQGD